MNLNPKYITAGVTLAAAVVTAHLMQSGDSPAGRSSATQVASMAATAATVQVPTKPKPALTPNKVTLVAAQPIATAPEASEPVTANVQDASLPPPPADALMPAPLPQVGADLQNRMSEVLTEASTEEALTTEPERNQFGLTCGAILTASAKEMAMISLALTAPCRGDQSITVAHAGMTFSGKINHLGTYTAEIPALLSEADFVVTFEDGAEAVAYADVPMADEVERVVLQYQGASGLQIHALEFGADYDEDGHVWMGAARDPETAARVGGGYMTVLGLTDQIDPLIAEIYTYPTNQDNREGVVRLNIEAEVTALNCETEATGQTIQSDASGLGTPVDLTVAMPDCTAIGEYLVLKNLLRDLKIASN